MGLAAFMFAPAGEAVGQTSLEVNGHQLSANQEAWVLLIRDEVVPELLDEHIQVAARATWWALKEGVLSLSDPLTYSSCGANERLGWTETCSPGLAWQVGISGVQVPNFSEATVADAIADLWSERSDADVLKEVLSLAGIPIQPWIPDDPGYAIFSSSGSLRKSWLLRHPVLGVLLVERNVTSECIDSLPPRTWCFGTGWPESAKFAPDQGSAMQSIADLEEIFSSVEPATTPGIVSNLRLEPHWEGRTFPDQPSDSSLVADLSDAGLAEPFEGSVEPSGELVLPDLPVAPGFYTAYFDSPYYLGNRIARVFLRANRRVVLPTLLGGDLNDDEVINTLDWSVMSPLWFTDDATADINGDGTVNSIDFSYLNKNWDLLGDDLRDVLGVQ